MSTLRKGLRLGMMFGLVLTLVFTLAACGGTSDTTDEATEDTTGDTTGDTSTTDDTQTADTGDIEAKLVGKWSGKDAAGKDVSIEFAADKTAKLTVPFIEATEAGVMVVPESNPTSILLTDKANPDQALPGNLIMNSDTEIELTDADMNATILTKE